MAVLIKHRDTINSRLETCIFGIAFILLLHLSSGDWRICSGLLHCTSSSVASLSLCSLRCSVSPFARAIPPCLLSAYVVKARELLGKISSIGRFASVEWWSEPRVMSWAPPSLVHRSLQALRTESFKLGPRKMKRASYSFTHRSIGALDCSILCLGRARRIEQNGSRILRLHIERFKTNQLLQYWYEKKFSRTQYRPNKIGYPLREIEFLNTFPLSSPYWLKIEVEK